MDAGPSSSPPSAPSNGRTTGERAIVPSARRIADRRAYAGTCWHRWNAKEPRFSATIERSSPGRRHRQISDRPIFNRESRYSSKITAIACHHGGAKLLGNRCDPQIIVLHIQFGAYKYIELHPPCHGHRDDRETISRNNE